MKRSKKLLATILAAFMVAAVPAVISGCKSGDDDGTQSGQNQGAVKLKDGENVSLKLNESKTFTVSEYVTANGNAVSIVPPVSDNGVAEASLNDGILRITGKQKGISQVKVKCGDVVIVFSVTVTADDQKNPAPKFSDIAGAVDINEGYTVEVALAPASGGDNFNISYSLANNLISGAEITGDKLKYTATVTGTFEIPVTASCVDKSDSVNSYQVPFKVLITVTDGATETHYTVTVDGVPERIKEGGTFTFPVYSGTPETGKEFVCWTVGQTEYSAGDTLTVNEDINVTAKFVNKKYAVSIDGVVSQVEHGTEIILSRDKYTGNIADGYQLGGWLVNDGKVSVGHVLRVQGPLTITAVIEPVPETPPEKIKDGGKISFRLSEGTTNINVSEYIKVNGNAVSVISSDENTVTANETGGVLTVTAVAAGKTTVILTCKTVRIEFEVTVKNAAPTFDNGQINIDKYFGTEGTLQLEPQGASTYEYGYSVNGASVDGDGLLTVNATESKTLTVNVTATDTATGEVETLSFTVTVNVTDTTSYRIKNGGFEDVDASGNPTMAHWSLTTLDGEPLNLDEDVKIVQSSAGYWGGTGAYNHAGKYHFNGQEGGIPEGMTYKLTSEPFTLGGSGYISFKIGGRATVVKIYDKATGVLVAAYHNTAFADIGIGEDNKVHVHNGARQAVMTTYIADLRAYLGLELYFVLEDGASVSWGHAVLDDVITYYETAPDVSGKFDTVKNLCGCPDETYPSRIAWQQAQSSLPSNRLQIVHNVETAVVAAGTVNLNDYLFAEGKLAGDLSAVIQKQIIKVESGDGTFTENFGAFAIEAGKRYTVTYKLVCGDYQAETVLTIVEGDDKKVLNGSFEGNDGNGSLDGWTYKVAIGSGDFGRLENSAYYWKDENNLFNKDGNWLFTGIETPNNLSIETGRGSLRSSVFTLQRNGWISFLLGGAHNVNCGIRIRSASDGAILAEFNNSDKGHDGVMDRYKYQFSGMDSDVKCFVEIFDNAENGWGLVVVDDIRTDCGVTEPDGTLIANVK